MPVFTQPPSTGDLLKYEDNANYTRETVILLAGTDYAIGSVLGIVTASGKYTLSPDTGATGEEVANAVLLEAIDATSADAIGLILARGPAIVSKAQLVFDASVSTAVKITAKENQLVAAGIVPRDAA
jgi:head decoration protein D